MDIKEAATPSPSATPGKGTATPTPTPDPYRLFKAERQAALSAVTLDGDGRGVYTTALGHRIVFGLTEESGHLATIVSIDDKPSPDWKTSGGVIEADGQGHATIKGAGEVVIDFSDPMHPSRTVSTPTPSP